jgi:hypothetical protein
VLRKVGFGHKFRELVAILLPTASIWMFLTSEPDPLIWHRWGLRRPLLPMLFVVFINSHNRLLAKAKELGVPRPIALWELLTRTR